MVDANESPNDPQREANLKRMREMMLKHEITICQEQELTVLLDYNIVFLCDDSGSMMMSSLSASKRTPANNITRWEELKDTVKKLSEIACFLDSSGIDVHFLNRESVENVTSPDMLDEIFSAKPQGGTPLARRVMEISEVVDKERPVLLLIATDGEPDEGPVAFQDTIEAVLAKGGKPWKIQILACTPDDREVAWLNNFDKKFKDVDVMDDYHNEYDEVISSGRNATFTKADYVCKALLGPVVARFDAADENPVEKYVPPPAVVKRQKAAKQASNDGCNCSIC
eukprot:TRINITY_DN655_c0_g3_i2.p1 TRINITY_DN655_c0_g3~~TRINITY_DN655_c0_g3_i2.p1  ORF type:complete len:296 (+),score=60.63 TRINITY_DN655_c0_g3_i2:41-889(+)